MKYPRTNSPSKSPVHLELTQITKIEYKMGKIPLTPPLISPSQTLHDLYNFYNARRNKLTSNTQEIVDQYLVVGTKTQNIEGQDDINNKKTLLVVIQSECQQYSWVILDTFSFSLSLYLKMIYL